MNTAKKVALVGASCLTLSLSGMALGSADPKATASAKADKVFKMSSVPYSTELKRQYIFVVDESEAMHVAEQKPRVDYEWQRLRKEFRSSEPLKGVRKLTHGISQGWKNMKKKHGESNWNRWETARMSMEVLVDYLSVLDDGMEIPVYTYKEAGFRQLGVLKNPADVKPLMKKANIKGKFSKMAPVLSEVVSKHHKVSGSKYDKTTIIVFAGGTTDDKFKVKEVIEKQAAGVKDDTELAYSFLQIGDDAGVDSYLKFLDDDLEGKDIVDTKKVADLFAGEGPFKICMDAIHD